MEPLSPGLVYELDQLNSAVKRRINGSGASPDLVKAFVAAYAKRDAERSGMDETALTRDRLRQLMNLSEEHFCQFVDDACAHTQPVFERTQSMSAVRDFLIHVRG